MPSVEDRLTVIEEQFDHLVEWTHQHTEEHTADFERTTLILGMLSTQGKRQDTHDTNHHGTASTIKRDGLLVTAVSILYGLVELFRGFGVLDGLGF